MRRAVGPLRTIFFDFDGVIVESVGLKAEAFRRLFAVYPDHVDAIVQLHLNNPGVSRYEKFRRIHRDFLGAELDDADLARLDERFSELVFERVIACELVPGAMELLERVAPVQALYVSSATPEGELRRIVEARSLTRFFDDVRGSPASKESIIAEVLSTTGTAPREALVIGDAASDQRSAASNGVPFVGRLPDGRPNPFTGPDVETVADLAELNSRWTEVLSSLGFEP